MPADDLANPLDVLLAGAGIDDDQEVVFAELVEDDIIHERPVGVEHGGVVRLADLQLAGVVHQQLLHGGERVGSAQLDVAHVRDVEQADSRCATAMCSATRPAYCTGMSQPPKSTMRALCVWWVLWSAVRRRAEERFEAGHAGVSCAGGMFLLAIVEHRGLPVAEWLYGLSGCVLAGRGGYNWTQTL